MLAQSTLTSPPAQVSQRVATRVEEEVKHRAQKAKCKKVRRSG